VHLLTTGFTSSFFLTFRQSLAMLIVYLKTFEKESDSALDLAFDTIQQFVLRTIKLPEIHHIDILQLRAITHFKGS
jgi:hypothetical protein